ncbi:MAG: CBS domain-containing protein [Thermoplasmata archaeon]
MVDEDKPIKDMRVSDVLALAGRRKKPATVGPDASLSAATDALLKNRETRKVYVVDKDNKLLGTLTLETLLRHAGYRLGVRGTGMTSFIRMLAEISDDKVSEAMAKPVKVLEDELILNVTKLMVENHLNDLPVVDNSGRLVAELNGLDILLMAKSV